MILALLESAPFVLGPAEFGVFVLATGIVFAIFGVKYLVRGARTEHMHHMERPDHQEAPTPGSEDGTNV